MMYTLEDVTGIKHYYDQHGYVIIGNIIPRRLIDNYLAEYEKLEKRVGMHSALRIRAAMGGS
ncbi:MAG TPA: hypothetical protein ENH11_01575 [Candidatus Acetothermia bacterium]|nr:hypothetical protein [Candidatus Acetothermia bacterium]